MKIYTIGANRIRLIISQWILHLLGILILIGSFLAISFLMLEYTIFCKDKQLNSANNCSLERSLFNVYRSTTHLGTLKSAYVQSGQGSKGGTVYSVTIVTDNNTVSLTGGSSSGRKNKDIAADAINTYISKSLDTHFKVPYPTPWWVYALVAIFPLLGIFLLTARGAIIDFNRLLKTIVIERKGFFHTDKQQVPFSEVDRVIIEEHPGSKGGKTYRLALALKDKPPLPLIETYDASLSKKERIAKQLNDFIRDVDAI
ncbi:hypothetical protein [uncultured Legionella sp.]|uniref:hypothetical protein n=1 Tax=uncultured Legionella sp. TaxID=210934 RepID=UPI0026277822|nr:hypothetical protein [uncultured Legionella sp.]